MKLIENDIRLTQNEYALIWEDMPLLNDSGVAYADRGDYNEYLGEFDGDDLLIPHERQVESYVDSFGVETTQARRIRLHLGDDWDRLLAGEQVALEPGTPAK